MQNIISTKTVELKNLNHQFLQYHGYVKVRPWQQLFLTYLISDISNHLSHLCK